MGAGEDEAGAPIPGFLPDSPAEAVDYTIKLSESERKALATRLCREFEHYESQTESRRENAREWRDAASMMPDTASGEDWQSDARAPFTRLACQNHTTRLNQQLLGNDPLFTAVAKKPTFRAPEMPQEVPLPPLLPVIESVMNSLLEEADFPRIARRVHREVPIVSPCAVRVQWKRDVRRVPVLQVRTDIEEATLLMETGMDPVQAYLAPMDRDAEGNARLKLGFEDRVVKDGVDLAMVPFERLVMFPATAETRDELWAVGERLMLRGIDLQRGAEQGVYLEEAVEALLTRKGDNLPDTTVDRLDRSGLEDGGSVTAQDDAKYQEFDCIQLCLLDDLNGDDALEWNIVTVHLESETLLRCQLSPYEHGRPFYHVFAYIEDSLMGQSIAELVAVLQDQGNACQQQFTDLVELLVASGGSFFYDKTAGFNPNRFTLAPGTQIPVDNINGIKPFDLAQNIPAALQHLLAMMDVLKTQNEMLTASSNVALGRETDSQKTLGEINQVTNQAAQIFEDYSRQVALDWAAVADLVRLTAAQYADKGQVQAQLPADLFADPLADPAMGDSATVRSSAAPEKVFQSVPASILRADVDLVPSGLSGYSDQGARLQRDMLVLNTLLAQPSVQQDPTITADLLAQFLQDVRWPDWQGLGGKLQQAAAMQAQMMQLQAMMGLQAGAAQQKQGEEAHAGAMQDAKIARTEKVGQMMLPPEEPAKANGKAKK